MDYYNDSATLCNKNVNESTLVSPVWPWSENQAKVRKEKGPACSNWSATVRAAD